MHQKLSHAQRASNRKPSLADWSGPINKMKVILWSGFNPRQPKQPKLPLKVQTSSFGGPWSSVWFPTYIHQSHQRQGSSIPWRSTRRPSATRAVTARCTNGTWAGIHRVGQFPLKVGQKLARKPIKLWICNDIFQIFRVGVECYWSWHYVFWKLDSPMIRLPLAPRSVSLVIEGDWIGYLGHVGC